MANQAQSSQSKGLPQIPKSFVETAKRIQGSIGFKGSDFVYYPKNHYWYIAMILAGVVFVGVSVLFKQYTLAAALFVGFFVVIQLASRKPNKFDCMVDSEGVHFGNKTYLAAHIKSFWIIPDKTTSTLYFSTTERLKPMIFTHVDNSEIKRVYDFIVRYFPQEQRSQEDASNWISRIFRF